MSQVTGFLNRTMEVRGAQRRYVVYVPFEYNAAQSWPLILFLHGKGERGDTGLPATEVGIGPAIRQHPDRFPSLVLFPQCPADVMWDGAVADVDEALRRAREEFSIDPKRQYITGISMGGYATWFYGATHAETFAAMLPICGGGDKAWAINLKGMPIRAFHGAKDKTVKPRESRRMVEAASAHGADVGLEIYRGVGHNSWDRAYGDAEVIRWLFAQRKA